MTREGSGKMPSTRGGNGGMTPSREQLDAMRKEREIGQRKVTVAEFERLVTKINTLMLSLTSRQETLYTTLRRMEARMEALIVLVLSLADRAGIEVSQETIDTFGATFEDLYEDSMKRYFAWRKKVEHLRKAPLALIQAETESWNRDESNPKISLMAFGMEWVVTHLGPINPDPMPLEGRRELLALLDVPEELRETILTGGEKAPPPEAPTEPEAEVTQ